MKKIFWILTLCISFSIMGQSQESDFFNFYKGGNKYKKPVKYVLFDGSAGDIKKEVNYKIYFYMGGETFIYDSKINKKDTFLVDKSKFTFDKAEDLQQMAYQFYKEKKQLEERKMKLKNPILYPVTDFSPYFKIFVLEKTKKNTLLKYEVDWIYSTF
ncbi:hypothetical protein [Flavobacterium turcicum]|uniref:GLPGLI family protein n=1 Tax=Flavobacterium turcicum TaxID=2764718 RepID=A0ABR7JC39_9FLAO|nr:hypothetical protein [Flavobacterium turcicum]MBC5862067.1 hypothetical protein [Flavobacterium turcicum]NHL00798.1 hypothetical protein [Flavobacterium turcicum]